MTERWISTKKHYCKFCNSWFPDTKLGHQQHESTDRHKRNIQRNLSRIQRNDLIANNSGLKPETSTKSAVTGTAHFRNKKANYAGYGYGDRDDMAKFVREGKQAVDFEELNRSTTEERYKRVVGEAKVGKWEIAQVIAQERDPTEKEIKQEEENGLPMTVGLTRTSVYSEKRERAKSPDTEDLLRFKVQEKTYPTKVKEEGEEETNIPTVGFKKRKLGPKSTRISGAL